MLGLQIRNSSIVLVFQNNDNSCYTNPDLKSIKHTIITCQHEIILRSLFAHQMNCCGQKLLS